MPKAIKRPFRHKRPKGWVPGVGKSSFKTGAPVAPTIVRDRNQLVRSVLQSGKAYGHTHAIFRAHPDCCPICQQMDGRRQRLDTVLKWKYPTAHPNCRCHWDTARVVRKSDQITRASRLVLPLLKERRSRIVFHKAVPRSGLHQEKVQTVRGPALRGVKDNEGTIQAKPDKTDATPDIAEDMPKLAPKVKEYLNGIVSSLRDIAPGNSSKVSGTKVERHKNGVTFRVGGVIFHGLRATSLGVAALERLAATAGQTATGTYAAGAEMQHGGGTSKAIAAVAARTPKLPVTVPTGPKEAPKEKKSA